MPVGDVFVLFYWSSFRFLKDDESLRKWKELLLGSIDLSIYGGTLLSLSLSLNFLGFHRP